MAQSETSTSTTLSPASIETLRTSGLGLIEGVKPAHRPQVRKVDKVSVLDNTMRVTTPENISFEYQLAGPFRRFLAYLVDVLITLTAFGGIAFVVFLFMTFVVAPLAQWLGMQALADTIFGAAVGFLLILYFLVYWFYGAFFETYFNGQTLGKRASRLRVLSVNGHAIDGVQATLRNFFRLLDVWPAISLTALMDFRDVDLELEQVANAVTFPTFLVALTVMTLSRRFQRVGDLVADTVVVIDSNANRPNLVAFSDPRVASLAELIPQHFVASSNLAKAIASFVDLRQTVHHQRANEIAAHVAVPLMEKFGIAKDTNYDLFICALYFKTFVDARHDEVELSKAEIAQATESRINFLASSTLLSLQSTSRATPSEAPLATSNPFTADGGANESR